MTDDLNGPEQHNPSPSGGADAPPARTRRRAAVREAGPPAARDEAATPAAGAQPGEAAGAAPDAGAAQAAPATRRRPARRAAAATAAPDAADATPDTADADAAPAAPRRRRARGAATPAPEAAAAETGPGGTGSQMPPGEPVAEPPGETPAEPAPRRRRGRATIPVDPFAVPDAAPVGAAGPPSGSAAGEAAGAAASESLAESLAETAVPDAPATRRGRGSRRRTPPPATALFQAPDLALVEEAAVDVEIPAEEAEALAEELAEDVAALDAEALEALGTEDIEELDEALEEAEEAGEGGPEEAGQPSGGGRRRRRRGRRGRGRAAGDGAAGEPPAGAPAGAAEGAEGTEGEEESPEPAAETAAEEESAATSARRRRRRRRGGSGNGDGNGNGEAAERAPREREGRDDDVQGVRGSTRIEARRQRRRESRETQRRRPQVISESEFLARREAVHRVMVVREARDRTQVAVLEDGVLVEHYVAKPNNTSLVGNVYLGRVQNVLPSMEAAFVDIGRGRNAVLYAGEVNYDASQVEGGRPQRIEQALKSGDPVMVQVTKDPIGHKGARLTSQISLPGRYLVYIPEGERTGISRKLPDTERTRLKSILKRVMPEGAGFIVRTAAEGASEDDLARDVATLEAQWQEIKAQAGTASAPAVLYAEPDVVIRVVRDLFNEDFAEMVVQGEEVWDTVEQYVEHVAPDLGPRLRRYTGQDVFAEHRVDEQLAKALDRKVWLPSGGYLVIDRTEAMVVVDVNTGKFTGKGGNLEETVTRNNLEAAEEIVRQLRLRDLGGIIVIDFIDMVLESNRDLVLRRLTECLGRDRTKHQVAEVTSLGLVQMTRKRVGQGLLESFSETCKECGGRGVKIVVDPFEPAAPVSRRRRGIPAALVASLQRPATDADDAATASPEAGTAGETSEHAGDASEQPAGEAERPAAAETETGPSEPEPAVQEASERAGWDGASQPAEAGTWEADHAPAQAGLTDGEYAHAEPAGGVPEPGEHLDGEHSEGEHSEGEPGRHGEASDHGEPGAPEHHGARDDQSPEEIAPGDGQSPEGIAPGHGEEQHGLPGEDLVSPPVG